MDLKMYILVNKDIKINKGKLGGQVGHVVATYFYNVYNKIDFKGIPNDNDILDLYMEQQKKILLYCSEEKLLELEEEGYIRIRDKGLTDLKPNTLTCVNLGIIDRSKELNKELEFIKKLDLVR